MDSIDINIIKEGGPIFIIILLCGLAAIIVFLGRLIHLHRSRIQFADFLNGVFNILEKGKFREASAICSEVPGPISMLMHSAIMHRHESRDELRLVLENTGRAEIARMERRLTVLSTIVQATPLLGLLGGLIGILNTVIILRAELPLVQTIDLTSGLLQALINAIAGLAVAIPSYIMFNILVVRIDRIVLDMEQASADIIAFMARIPLDAPNAEEDTNTSEANQEENA